MPERREATTPDVLGRNREEMEYQSAHVRRT